jgi:hypothetical protein
VHLIHPVRDVPFRCAAVRSRRGMSLISRTRVPVQTSCCGPSRDVVSIPFYCLPARPEVLQHLICLALKVPVPSGACYCYRSPARTLIIPIFSILRTGLGARPCCMLEEAHALLRQERRICLDVWRFCESRSQAKNRQASKRTFKQCKTTMNDKKCLLT